MPRRTPSPVDSRLHIRTARAEKIDNHRRKVVLYGRRRAAKHRRHGHDRIEDPLLLGLISLGTAPFFDSSRLSGSAARFRRPTCSILPQRSAPLVRVAGLSVFLVIAPHRPVRVRPVRIRLRRAEHISTVVWRRPEVAGESDHRPIQPDTERPMTRPASTHPAGYIYKLGLRELMPRCKGLRGWGLSPLADEPGWICRLDAWTNH